MYEPTINLGDKRYQLQGGRYPTPRVRIGTIVKDAIRGDVKVCELTAGRIQWPLGKQGKHKGFILFRGLLKALSLESNIAICHWWGVTPQTVTKWRKTLGIVGTTAGTSKLRTAYATHEGFAHVLKAAHAKARDPERCAKIAAARLGKPRSAEVIEGIRLRSTGRKASEETRRRMREAAKRRRQPEDQAE